MFMTANDQNFKNMQGVGEGEWCRIKGARNGEISSIMQADVIYLKQFSSSGPGEDSPEDRGAVKHHHCFSMKFYFMLLISMYYLKNINYGTALKYKCFK